MRAEWSDRRAARTVEFDRALRELQTRMPDVDPERYLDVERRIEQLAPLRTARKQLQARLEEARRARGGLLIELLDARGEKHRVRERAAQGLNEASGGAVRVELEFQGDRHGFLAALRALKTGARNDALERIVMDPAFSPSELVRLVRERQLSGRWGLPAGQASLLERSIDEETLLRLEVAELPDRVTLALDVGPAGTRDYRPLDKLSPGQKSTAILLLIMQSSHDPLLIDQPEDDLDNRFIYDDIVQRLRAAKPARQFVIATHNANIPILGMPSRSSCWTPRSAEAPRCGASSAPGGRSTPPTSGTPPSTSSKAGARRSPCAKRTTACDLAASPRRTRRAHRRRRGLVHRVQGPQVTNKDLAPRSCAPSRTRLAGECSSESKTMVRSSEPKAGTRCAS